MIEAGWRWKLAHHDKARLVTKKPAAKSAVVRDKTLAVPRLDKKPLVELIKPPPSDFCNNTTPMSASTSMR
jgi:hypothetical protein